MNKEEIERMAYLALLYVGAIVDDDIIPVPDNVLEAARKCSDLQHLYSTDDEFTTALFNSLNTYLNQK